MTNGIPLHEAARHFGERKLWARIDAISAKESDQYWPHRLDGPTLYKALLEEADDLLFARIGDGALVLRGTPWGKRAGEPAELVPIDIARSLNCGCRLSQLAPDPPPRPCTVSESGSARALAWIYGYLPMYGRPGLDFPYIAFCPSSRADGAYSALDFGYVDVTILTAAEAAGLSQVLQLAARHEDGGAKSDKPPGASVAAWVQVFFDKEPDLFTTRLNSMEHGERTRARRDLQTQVEAELGRPVELGTVRRALERLLKERRIKVKPLKRKRRMAA